MDQGYRSGIEGEEVEDELHVVHAFVDRVRVMALGVDLKIDVDTVGTNGIDPRHDAVQRAARIVLPAITNTGAATADA